MPRLREMRGHLARARTKWPGANCGLTVLGANSFLLDLPSEIRDESAALTLAPGRRAYVHVARGTVKVNGVQLAAGDAARVEDEARVALAEGSGAEVLVFDLN